MAPPLYPIVIRPLCEPPFECAGQGLRYNGHVRTPLLELRSLLFPKRVNSASPLNLSRPKSWWQAQLALYGLQIPKNNLTIAALRTKLEAALKEGLCDHLPNPLQVLETRLNVQFLQENSAARKRKFLESGGSDEAAAAVEDPLSFLQEKLLSGYGGSKVCVLKKLDSGERAGVQGAAERLGLVCISADAPDGGRWMVVAKERDAVAKEIRRIGKETSAVQDREKAAKRQKMEDTHAQAVGQAMQSLWDSLGQSLGESLGQSLGQSLGHSLGESLRQTLGQTLRQTALDVQSLGASNSNIIYSQSSRGELSDSGFGRDVRTEVSGSYKESCFPKPLSVKQADDVLKKWGQQTKKRMSQSDFKRWMSEINKDACSLEIHFTSDDSEPDTGLKKCDFSLVIKSSPVVSVNTLAVLSLQSGDGLFNSDKEIGVAIRRSEQVIKASGCERKYCVAGVTNGMVVQWFLTERRAPDNFHHCQSLEYSFRESLCAMLICKPKDLYYNKLDPIQVDGKELVFNILLGFGATSKVYSCQYDGQNVAAKLFNEDQFDPDYEASILESLRSVHNIPTVVGKYHGILIMKPIGQSWQHGVRLEQKYAVKMCNIVDTLEAAHKLGYVHRDVRVANMLRVEQGKAAGMMLIDWGFAAKSNTEFPFAGSYVTASDHVLDQLSRSSTSSAMPPPGKKMRVALRSSASRPWHKNPSLPRVTFIPEDDLISLVRSLYVYTKRSKVREIQQQTSCEDLKAFWAKEFATNKSFLRCQQVAATCNYKGLKLCLTDWADYLETDR